MGKENLHKENNKIASSRVLTVSKTKRPRSGQSGSDRNAALKKPCVSPSAAHQTPSATRPKMENGKTPKKKLSKNSKVKMSPSKTSQRPSEAEKSQQLYNILSTLKKEYNNIETASTKTLRALDTIKEGKVKEIAKPEQPFVDLEERNKALKKRLDQIIEKHTGRRINTTASTGSNSSKHHTAYIDSLYVQNVKQRHDELMRCITSSIKFPAGPNLKFAKKKPSPITIINQPKPPAQSTRSKTWSQTDSFERPLVKDDIKTLRDFVDKAIKGNKIFQVFGHYYSIRNALLQRGWVEKLHPQQTYTISNVDASIARKLQFLSIPELSLGLKDKELGRVYKQVILSKMIGNHPVTFIWDLNREAYRTNFETFKHTLVNFISKNKFSYANKQGLCESSKQAHWYNNPGVSYLRVPRSYCLANNEDTDEFSHDFKITAAMSFLKWIVNVYDNKVSKLISNSGKVPINHFHFALQECAKFARRLKHEDIDKEIGHATEQEWKEFLDQFYTAVHVGSHFKHTSSETEVSLVHKSKTMLKKLSELWPFVEMDGYMNIWLLKPSYGSRGVGIHFCRTLQYVLKVVNEHKASSYVVQKYIERPLLIHNTKFDIRQWFLVSCTMPLTIWIYKECYIRFSSQTYNLRKLHESIHLTNNSVQSKYNNGNRDPCLPSHNMWFLKDFKEHLSNLGYPKVYDEIIFPGMKESITAAILSGQDQIFKTPKAFELHGADFMITEDFVPWLIEINSKPALSPSTPVTSKLCPMVLEDVIKVVIDHARDSKAPTGSFQPLYQEPKSVLPQIDTTTLKIDGTPLIPGYFLTPEEVKQVEKKVEPAMSDDSMNIVSTSNYIKYIGKEMKKTLQELLGMIDKERMRRQHLRDANVGQKSDDLFSFMYCEDMERLKTNMKEIELIFKSDTVGKEVAQEGKDRAIAIVGAGGKAAADLSVNLTKADDTLLHSNSVKIKNAISTLELEEVNNKNSYGSIISIIDSIKFEGTKRGRSKLAPKVS